MADDWEDWEDETFQPKLEATTNGQTSLTKGQAAPAAAKEPDEAKFAGEDEEDSAPPAWEKSVPKPQQKKEVPKKSYEDRGTAHQDEGPLDDPIEEKLRQQRLVEDADFRAAQELFGGQDLDKMQLKSAKDFEDFAATLVHKYVEAHSRSPHYKTLVKALFKATLKPLDVQQTKDIETTVAGIRADKVKEKTASDAAKKAAGKKKTLNVGRSGGSAGLDDYKFDNALDVDDDFM